MNIPHRHNNYPSAYKSFSDIPTDFRLESYEYTFEGENLLDEYISSEFHNEGYHEDYVKRIKHAMESWRKICNKRGCHPALASPNVVKVWCTKLLQERSKLTIKYNYMVIINNFYRYMMWHVDFPHTYNPVQFAVREYTIVSKVWSASPKGEIDD